MKMLVVGAGVVGESLAEQLSLEGHQISIIDSNRQKIRKLEEKLDVLAIHGNAGMPSVLDRAGIRSARIVIAVTDIDEVNLVVGMLASRMGVEHRIVRIRNEEYLEENSIFALHELGIDHVINPEPTIVSALEHMIQIPGSSDFATLAGGQVFMLGFDIADDSPVVGQTMAELRNNSNLDAFLVLYITRGEQVIVPKGRDRVEAGDNVHVLVASGTAKLVAPFIHRNPKKVDHVIIAGASRLGLQLAKRIQDQVEQLFLIEPQGEAAYEAGEQLRHTTVLKGEDTSLDMLSEASLEKCDLFCGLSDDEQRNMLSALLAKRHSSTKTAVLVHQPEYVTVMDSLGVEIVISPRLVTVGEILMHVRRGHVHSVTRLAENRGELLEMEASESSPAVKGKIKELDFPSNALVGAIVREGKMEIPTGDSQIQVGDIVVVFALDDAIGKIEKLFTRRRWF